MQLYEIRVFDNRKEEGKERIIVPLGDLVHCLEKIFPQVTTGRWEFSCMADGHGYKVIDISDRLFDSEVDDTITVAASYLVSQVLDDTEYFSDAYIKPVGHLVEFGIFDSTFLYVIGERETVEMVAADFENTEIHEWRKGWKHYRTFETGYGGFIGKQ